jgi:putative SOS response-associated peptidase YedK
MCGRFSVAIPSADLFDEFGMTEPAFDIHPRFNVAPTQLSPVLLRGKDGAPALGLFRWGLIPAWAKDESIGNKMINARAETLAEKPAFRGAYERRRCLVLADGWYEWKQTPGGKVPMRMHLKSGRPLAFAGIWERWRGAGEEGGPVESFAIVTTDASDRLREVHDRMPVVLPPGARERWLDPEAGRAELDALLRPWESDDLDAYAVSRLVNSPRNDAPEVILPAPPETEADSTPTQEGLQ